MVTPYPLVRTGDQVVLTFAAPVIPGTPVNAIVGPSLANGGAGLPSFLKSG